MNPFAADEDNPQSVLPIRPPVFQRARGIIAAFSTRAGGVSQGPWDSLNLGDSVGDAPDHVARNRMRFFLALGLDPSRVAFAGQVHGTTVRVVNEPGLFPECDGLVTSTNTLTLALQGADCAIVLLADPHAGVIGAAHAGWRGFLSGIVPSTVERMFTMGARPDRTVAYTSPCISVDHFEVGEEVAERFPPALVRRDPGRRKPHLDLKRGLRGQLLELGLRDPHIEIDPACTASRPEQFFSHRASIGLAGRHLGVISLSGFGERGKDRREPLS